MILRVITLWRVHVTSLTTSVSTMFILKAIISILKGHMINRILHSWPFYMKFMKLAKSSFHKFHMKWPLVLDLLLMITYAPVFILQQYIRGNTLLAERLSAGQWPVWLESRNNMTRMAATQKWFIVSNRWFNKKNKGKINHIDVLPSSSKSVS